MPGKGTTDAIFIIDKFMRGTRQGRKSCIIILWIWRRHLSPDGGAEMGFEETGCG